LTGVAGSGLLAMLIPAITAAQLRPSYGHLEHVRVIDKTALEVTAALNPHNETSLLYAYDCKYFQRDGDTWVRFVIDNGSVMPESKITLERPILKDIHVPQSGGGIGHEPRVELTLCLGTQSFKTQLRLAPRNNFVPPLQLGAADLDGLGTVDPQRKFTQDPVCVPPQKSPDPLPPKT